MDFDQKTTKLHSQEVDEYLAKNGVSPLPRDRGRVLPSGHYFALNPPNGGVYMQPQILALGLKLTLTNVGTEPDADKVCSQRSESLQNRPLATVRGCLAHRAGV